MFIIKSLRFIKHLVLNSIRRFLPFQFLRIQS
nr:MAG TPA: hypothetical protein [Caudoviricetes sp.]